MNKKYNKEKLNSGKSSRSRTRTEDTRSAEKPEANKGRKRYDDTRSAEKPEASKGRKRYDDTRGAERPDGSKGRKRYDDTRSVKRPEASKGRKRYEEGSDSAKTWSNREELKLVDFDAEMHPDLLIGRNPVSEALKAGRTIEKVFVSKGAGGSIIKILGQVKENGIPIIFTDKQGLDRIAGCEKHQGIIAQVSFYIYKTIEDIFSLAEERGEEPFIVVLDNLEDPHNLGAIIRSAEGAGAHGIIIPKRNGVGVTQVVAKASAGAIEYMPVVKVTNIGDTLKRLKKEGLWVAACDMDGTEYSHQNLKGPFALVIGSEGAGVGRLIKEKCDFVVSIPMKGHVASLNASNAAAVLLYEIRKQRDDVK